MQIIFTKLQLLSSIVLFYPEYALTTIGKALKPKVCNI